MSKEAALAFATGQPAAAPTPAPAAATASIVAPVPVESTNAATPAPEPSKSEDLASSRFAAFAKKEQKLVHDREALQKERAEWEPKKVELEKFYNQAKTFEELRQKDPVAALKSVGFSDADIVNMMVDQVVTELTPEQKAAKAASDEIQKFKDEQAKEKLTAQQQRDQELIVKFKTEISDIIKKEADKLEYCAFYGEVAEDAVYRLVAMHLQRTGEMISAEEAASEMEKFYEETDKAMAKLKKRQPAAPPAPPAAPPTPPAAPPSRAASLTNRATATVASTVPRRETREEKRARLEQMLRNGG